MREKKMSKGKVLYDFAVSVAALPVFGFLAHVAFSEGLPSLALLSSVFLTMSSACTYLVAKDLLRNTPS